MLLPSTNAVAFRREASSQRPDRGFTLIELLTVIAIIGILVAITLGIAQGVKTRAAMGQTKTELSAIAQALEAYKQQYGDYPQTGAFSASSAILGNGPGNNTAEAKLFNALTGQLGPTLGAFTNVNGGKKFLDLSKFTLEVSYEALDKLAVAGEQNDALLDPWGNRYHYYYRATAIPPATPAWTASNYVLYSSGPDGLDTPPAVSGATCGLIDTTQPNNADNIYANQN